MEAQGVYLNSRYTELSSGRGQVERAQARTLRIFCRRAAKATRRLILNNEHESLSGLVPSYYSNTLDTLIYTENTLC